MLLGVCTKVADLQRQRNELQTTVDNATEAHRQELLPQIEDLRRELLEIEQDNFVEADRILTAEKESADFENFICSVSAEVIS